MLKTFSLLLLIIMSMATSAKEIIIPKNADGALYKPSAAKYNYQPGDVIILQGDYAYIYWDSVRGTALQPIIIRNRGQVRVGLNNLIGMNFYNSKHFILDGWGDTTISKYGIKIGPNGGIYTSQGCTPYMSTDYEIRGVEVQHTQVGFFANPLSTPYNMKNIWIHHNWVHDLDNPAEGHRSEGVYFGNTNVILANAIGWFENVRIEDNIFEDLWGDGIQLCRAKGYIIQRNIIRNYGKGNLQDQNTGIIAGGMSYGSVLNNTISNGTGTGIQVFGYDLNIVQGNKITATSTKANCDAIYISKRGGADVGPLQVDAIGNVIEGAARWGIFNDKVAPLCKAGLWSGNIVTDATAGKFMSNCADIIMEVLPVKVLLITVKVFTDGTTETTKP